MRALGVFLLAVMLAAFEPTEFLIALLAVILLTPFHLIGAAFDPGRYLENLFARYARTWEFWRDAL